MAATFASPAWAKEDSAPLTAWEASRLDESNEAVSTGVARARDRLDSATSTSSLDEREIVKISPTSLGDLLRNIPGLRAEAGMGENNASLTIRGLPLVANGVKYLQLQEDGLPVLQFGDFYSFPSDSFIRADFNVDQVESIRGGSASTFASNAPGGLINLQSKTGDVEGGSVQASTGLDYERYRLDFDYGGHLSDTWRFHFGGFYREGEGPRKTGYSGNQGGQFKFNVTKEFAGGYVRVLGKLLDDRNPLFQYQPMLVTGSDSHPKYSNVGNFSAVGDSLLSRNISVLPGLDKDNNLISYNVQDGMHIKAQSLGMEAKFKIGEWSVSNRMAYARQSGSSTYGTPLFTAPVTAAAFAVEGYMGLTPTGGSLVYASGPNKGQAIIDPNLNGNGLVVVNAIINNNIDSFDNFTNDLRVSRVWDMGGGVLTTTMGLYGAHQDFKTDLSLISILQDVAGGGNSALIDVVAADGHPVTTDGVVNYTGPAVGGHRVLDLGYGILAPYGSLNFHKGKLAIGASIRYDMGEVNGTTRNNHVGDQGSLDVNRDGVISDAEKTIPYAPFGNTTPVDYNYHYLSYSVSANYRWSENFSTFGRYSKGGRAAADRIQFSPAIAADGSLADKNAAYDPVKQAEVGLKFRKDALFLNVTGFWAKVSETNAQLQPSASGLALVLVQNSYRAFGAEFEGGIKSGPWSLTANATVTDARRYRYRDQLCTG
ncbi:MAG: TonB-dependent receptor [Novosphingobium sp.]